MYHYAVLGSYLLWRYFYLLEYGYSTVYYGSKAVKFVSNQIHPKKPDEELIDDFVLCDLD